jgi:hypothetical protein
MQPAPDITTAYSAFLASKRRDWQPCGFDVVLSPFAGIGSEGYQALKMGRKFLGIELKESYYQQAKLNLAGASSVEGVLL